MNASQESKYVYYNIQFDTHSKLNILLSQILQNYCLRFYRTILLEKIFRSSTILVLTFTSTKSSTGGPCRHSSSSCQFQRYLRLHKTPGLVSTKIIEITETARAYNKRSTASMHRQVVSTSSPAHLSRDILDVPRPMRAATQILRC